MVSKSRSPVSARGESVSRSIRMLRDRWSARKGDGLTIALFLTPALIMMTMFVFYPIVVTVYFALFDFKGLMGARTFVGLGNFEELVQDSVAQHAFLNNIAVLASAVIIALPLAYCTALLLSKANLRMRGLYRTAYFLPSVLPIVIVGLVWSWMYNPQWGLFNRMLSAVGLDSLTQGWLGNSTTALPAVLIVTIWQRVGYYIVIYLSALAAIPTDIYDALRVDGANLWQATWHVILPMLRPTIAVTVAMAIIGSIRNFDVVWIMTGGGPIHATELLATYMFKSAFFSAARLGYASAIAVVLLLLALVLTVAQLRLIEGEVSQY